ncbi:MAG TPA: HAMP domain-containing histidine kinase [Gammaproteobacteria bacterium]|nr:HAMP domain-containing histidine kinase [Gammaproteobacteria bacterium]
MKYRTSLQNRIAIAFALLGTLVSLVLAGAAYLLTVSTEDRLIAETLATELEDYMARYREDPQARQPSGVHIRAYVLKDGENPGLPPGLVDLPPGQQHLKIGDRGYYAEARRSDGRKFVVLYDDAQVRQRERQFKAFLIGGILLMTALSAALGLWLSGEVISPLRELARRVALLDPGTPGLPLARHFPRDELGQLARNFDDYVQRLRAFIEREQAFTGDVSHELRTPLTIIEGATEVLAGDTGLDAEQQRRIGRIARAAREMSEVTAALLELARERSSAQPVSECALEQELREVVENHRYLLKGRAVQVELRVDARPSLAVECALLRIVLANLVRNAFSYTREGRIDILLGPSSIVISDTGPGIPREQIQQIFKPFFSGQGGEGIGLSLVQRICRHYGWEIGVDSIYGEGTRFLLDFAPVQRVRD